jgi:hypothetical protein
VHGGDGGFFFFPSYYLPGIFFPTLFHELSRCLVLIVKKKIVILQHYHLSGSDGRKWDMALPALEPIAAEEMG